MSKNRTLNSIILPLKNTVNFLKKFGIDKYIKKLTIEKFLAIMIYAQITKSESLRAIAISINSSNEIKETVHIKSISYSQLSRKLRNTDSKHFKMILDEAMKEAYIKLKPNEVMKNIGNLHMIDSSTISMSVSRYQWADFRKTKSGVKLHLRTKYINGTSIPDKVIVTNARPADRKQMDNLVVSEKGAINVLDRAYVDYKCFDSYCKDSIYFVTRSKSNSVVNVISTNPVAAESVVLSDKTVILGNKTNMMNSKLIIIETNDLNGKSLSILTNIFDQSAEKIANIYRLRWQIELFFKWLKQNLKIKKFYGFSKNAVVNQIYIAIITY